MKGIRRDKGSHEPTEGEHEVKLRAFCQRLLGWESDRQPEVDEALRSLCLARARRAALILHGEREEGLVPIARALHRRVLGDSAPFVVCGFPGRVAVAIAAAGAGTVCIRNAQRYSLRRDVDAALTRLNIPGGNVQLYLCVRYKQQSPERYYGESIAARFGSAPIRIPPFRSRESDLFRLIDEFASDAINKLSASEGCFTDDDRVWVRDLARSLDSIETATLRMVAIRKTGGIVCAAQLLGLTPAFLHEWFMRCSHGYPHLMWMRPMTVTRARQ